MVYLNMQGKITIGDVEFTSFNSFSVDKSVTETSDKASIILPRNYRKLLGKSVKDYIQPGMPVTLECGYDGILHTEFTGFVKPGISAADFPLTIECDQLYPLRQNNHILSYRNISLKSLLHTIAPGYTIEALDVDLGKISFNNKSSYQILQEIKKQYGFFSSIRGNILHVGFAFDFKPSFTQRHDYTIGKNVKDYSQLKYETDRAFNTRVEINVTGRDGKKKVYKFGSANNDAAVKKETVAFMSEATAKQKARALYEQYTYDGYTGTIIGFGNPVVNAGDSIRIINPVHTEREGTYLAEKSHLVYDDAMIERQITISNKVA